MKTLLQAAIEFERQNGGSLIHRDFWSDEHGAPKMMACSRDAFMAGAAAMAEIFASGQALKIEQTPKKYLVSCEIGGYGGYVSHTLTFAFNSREAIEQAGFFGQVPCSGLKVRPATEEDEKIEGVVHA